MEPGVKKYSLLHIKTGIRSFIYRLLHPGKPWWSRGAIELCMQLLRNDDRILEFGSGRSTIWLAERSAGITSIEHDEKWHNIVSRKINEEKLTDKIIYILAPLENNVKVEDQPYLQHIKMLQSSSVDFVIIDGKFRAYAVKLSLSLLKPGGVLVIDDAHRYLPLKPAEDVFPESEYREVWEVVYNVIGSWRSLSASDGIHRTTFYIKP